MKCNFICYGDLLREEKGKKINPTFFYCREKIVVSATLETFFEAM